MLAGEWPGRGCEHCKTIEEAGGESVERWKMNLVPIAMGFAEFDTVEEDLWTTQIAFSASDIEIVPTNKIK